MTFIADALNDYATNAREHPRFADRKSTVGASEIGQCIRKVFWLKNEGEPGVGVERDEGYVDTWGARQRGTVFESRFWVPAMRKAYGTRLKFAGSSQQTFTKNFLSATPDGLIWPLNKKEQKRLRTKEKTVMVECKTADPRTNLTEPKPENVYQTHVQMGLVRELTKFKPDRSILSYTDASFWSDVKEFVIDYDDRVYQVALERAARVMTSDSLENIPPEGWIAGGHECRYCPFTKACGIERRNLPYADEDAPDIDPQFAAEITDLAIAYRAAEDVRDSGDRAVRTVQEEIKNRLRAKGIRKVPGVVSWSPVKGRAGIDSKALQAAAVQAGIDVTQFETTGEPTDRLVVLIRPQTADDPPAATASGDLQQRKSKR